MPAGTANALSQDAIGVCATRGHTACAHRHGSALAGRTGIAADRDSQAAAAARQGEVAGDAHAAIAARPADALRPAGPDWSPAVTIWPLGDVHLTRGAGRATISSDRDSEGERVRCRKCVPERVVPALPPPPPTLCATIPTDCSPCVVTVPELVTVTLEPTAP